MIKDSAEADEYRHYHVVLTQVLKPLLPLDLCAEVTSDMAEVLTHAELRLEREESEFSLSELESHRLTQLLRDHLEHYMDDYEAWSFLSSTFLDHYFAPPASSSSLAPGSGSGEGRGSKECALCGRCMPLTIHHLIPRSTHAYFINHPPPDLPFTSVTKQALLEYTAKICRPCHSHIHSVVPDHKQLGREYHSLDLLRERDDVERWIKYIRKQRVTDVSMGTNVRYRR